MNTIQQFVFIGSRNNICSFRLSVRNILAISSELISNISKIRYIFISIHKWKSLNVCVLKGHIQSARHSNNDRQRRQNCQTVGPADRRMQANPRRPHRRNIQLRLQLRGQHCHHGLQGQHVSPLAVRPAANVSVCVCPKETKKKGKSLRQCKITVNFCWQFKINKIWLLKFDSNLLI